jgi:hypothetical protein
MTIKTKAIWIDAETKAALKEYAWANRTTAGAVIRAAIQDIIDNAADVSVLSDTTAMPVAKVHVNVKADEDWWNSGVAAAHAVGQPFTGLVRRRIRKVLAQEGFIA